MGFGLNNSHGVDAGVGSVPPMKREQPTKSGVPGSTRTSTERALNAFPLPLRYRHIEDQAGFEPAMGIASGLRVRPVRPLR
jgi:hypothetical protein